MLIILIAIIKLKRMNVLKMIIQHFAICPGAQSWLIIVKMMIIVMNIIQDIAT